MDSERWRKELRSEKKVKGRRWGVLAEAVCHVGELRLSFRGESQLRSCSAREGAFCAETSSPFIYLGFCSPIISILFWVFRRFQEVGFFFLFSSWVLFCFRPFGVFVGLSWFVG